MIEKRWKFYTSPVVERRIPRLLETMSRIPGIQPFIDDGAAEEKNPVEKMPGGFSIWFLITRDQKGVAALEILTFAASRCEDNKDCPGRVDIEAWFYGLAIEAHALGFSLNGDTDFNPDDLADEIDSVLGMPQTAAV